MPISSSHSSRVSVSFLRSACSLVSTILQTSPLIHNIPPSAATPREDLDTVFAPELPGLDRDAIRDWYNGYSWRGEERVYNPFDILLLFRRQSFEAYWFETGTRHF